MVKKWLKSEPKTEQTEPQTTMAYPKKIALTGGLFGVFGPSKNAYFEDVKKLLKMPKNDPKMIQKWFKIA